MYGITVRCVSLRLDSILQQAADSIHAMRDFIQRTALIKQLCLFLIKKKCCIKHRGGVLPPALYNRVISYANNSYWDMSTAVIFDFARCFQDSLHLSAFSHLSDPLY